MDLHCDTCARQRTSEPPASADHPHAAPDETIVIAPVILLMDRRSRVFVERRHAA